MIQNKTDVLSFIENNMQNKDWSPLFTPRIPGYKKFVHGNSLLSLCSHSVDIKSRFCVSDT